MQNILRKDKTKNEKWFRENKWYHYDDDKEMITDDYNCIILCPVCHMELHHGDNDEYNKKNAVKKETVIKQLMKKHKFDDKLKMILVKLQKMLNLLKDIFYSNMLKLLINMYLKIK